MDYAQLLADLAIAPVSMVIVYGVLSIVMSLFRRAFGGE